MPEIRFIELDHGKFDKKKKVFYPNQETQSFLNDLRGMSDHGLYFKEALNKMFNNSMGSYAQLVQALGVLTDNETQGNIELKKIKKVITDQTFAALNNYQRAAQESKSFGTAGDVTEFILGLFSEIEEKILIPGKYKGNLERTRAINKSKAKNILSRIKNEYMDEEREEEIDWVGKVGLYFDQNAHAAIITKLKNTFHVGTVPVLHKDVLGLEWNEGKSVVKLWSIVGALQRMAGIKTYVEDQVKVELNYSPKKPKNASRRREGQYRNKKYYPSKEKMGYFNQLHTMRVEGIASNSYLDKMFIGQSGLQAKNLDAFGSLADRENINHLKGEHIEFLRSKKFISELKRYLKLPNLGVQKIIAEQLLEMIEKDLKSLTLLKEGVLDKSQRTTLEKNQKEIERGKVAGSLVKVLKERGYWGLFGVIVPENLLSEGMLRAHCEVKNGKKLMNIEEILKLFDVKSKGDKVPREELSLKIMRYDRDSNLSQLKRNIGITRTMKDFLQEKKKKPNMLQKGDSTLGQYSHTSGGRYPKHFFLVAKKGPKKTFISIKDNEALPTFKIGEVAGLSITSIQGGGDRKKITGKYLVPPQWFSTSQ